MARKSKKRGKNKKNKKFKMKTHKATAKRFRLTGGGKLVRPKGNQGHFRRRKSKRVKREITKVFEVSADKHRKTIRRLAPYLGKYKKK